jgi:hypothetical protein
MVTTSSIWLSNVESLVKDNPYEGLFPVITMRIATGLLRLSGPGKMPGLFADFSRTRSPQITLENLVPVSLNCFR